MDKKKEKKEWKERRGTDGKNNKLCAEEEKQKGSQRRLTYLGKVKVFGVALHQEVLRPHVDGEVDHPSLLGGGAAPLVHAQDPEPVGVHRAAEVTLARRAGPTLTAAVHRTLYVTVVGKTAHNSVFLFGQRKRFESQWLGMAQQVQHEVLAFLDWIWSQGMTSIFKWEGSAFLSFHQEVFVYVTDVSALTRAWILCYYWKAKVKKPFSSLCTYRQALMKATLPTRWLCHLQEQRNSPLWFWAAQCK